MRRPCRTWVGQGGSCSADAHSKATSGPTILESQCVREGADRGACVAVVCGALRCAASVRRASGCEARAGGEMGVDAARGRRLALGPYTVHALGGPAARRPRGNGSAELAGAGRCRLGAGWCRRSAWAGCDWRTLDAGRWAGFSADSARALAGINAASRTGSRGRATDESDHSNPAKPTRTTASTAGHGALAASARGQMHPGLTVSQHLLHPLHPTHLCLSSAAPSPGPARPRCSIPGAVLDKVSPA